MKSLLFGIYKTSGNTTFSENIYSFSGEGKRKITEYHFPKFSLYGYEGSTGLMVEENERYFIAISGNNFSTEVKPFLSLEPQGIIGNLSNEISEQYTICLYDKSSEQLYVANDFFGLYPVFYSQTENNFLFCNEYQPLIFQETTLAEISIQQIIPYLEHGFTLRGTTFFGNIGLLSARQLLVVKNHDFTINEYADFTPIQYESYEKAMEALHTVLQKTVHKLTRRKNDFITLSGGLDTRIILGLTDETTRSQQTYQTFYLAPLNEENDKDVLIGKLLAKRFNLNHRVRSFEEITDDFKPAYFETIRTNQNQNVLTGLYGGELLSGILYDKVFNENTSSFINSLFDFSWKKYFRMFGKDAALQKSILSKSKRTFFFETLSSSFFSSVYSGSEGGWIHPWTVAQRYFSPYIDRDFLKVWFSIPETYLFDRKPLLYFDFYTRYIPEFKTIPTNSMLPNLEENGFTYYDEGIEPKQVKKSTSAHLYDEIQHSKGFQLIPDKYKTEAYLAFHNQKQRVIDFCVWYDYYLSFKKS